MLRLRGKIQGKARSNWAVVRILHGSGRRSPSPSVTWCRTRRTRMSPAEPRRLSGNRIVDPDAAEMLPMAAVPRE